MQLETVGPLLKHEPASLQITAGKVRRRPMKSCLHGHCHRVGQNTILQPVNKISLLAITILLALVSHREVWCELHRSRMVSNKAEGPGALAMPTRTVYPIKETLASMNDSTLDRPRPLSLHHTPNAQESLEEPLPSRLPGPRVKAKFHLNGRFADEACKLLPAWLHAGRATFLSLQHYPRSSASGGL